MPTLTPIATIVGVSAIDSGCETTYNSFTVRLIVRRIANASVLPRTTPRAEPSAPNSSPSIRNATRICRGDTPSVLRMPTSLRRRKIEISTVL